MPQFRAGQRLTADLLNLLAANPFRTNQVNSPDFDLNVGSWNDFAEVDFPQLEVDVPDGARMRVITSARLRNEASAKSTCYLSWRAEGANAIADQFTTGFGSGGTGLTKGSNVFLTGALAGGLTTIVPQYRISSGGSLTAEMTTGEITVEIVP